MPFRVFYQYPALENNAMTRLMPTPIKQRALWVCLSTGEEIILSRQNGIMQFSLLAVRSSDLASINFTEVVFHSCSIVLIFLNGVFPTSHYNSSGDSAGKRSHHWGQNLLGVLLSFRLFCC